MNRLSLVGVVAIALVSSAAACGEMLNTVVLQPGPDESKDIWTTNVFSYAPGGGGPGGGLDNADLRTGGWGDVYHTLIEFDLSRMPTTAVSATMRLYLDRQGRQTTPLYLDRITEPWDWRTGGTGSDNERLWWVDRPSATQIAYLPAYPVLGEWYEIDLTALYNDWQSGVSPNHGVQLRPQFNSNQTFNFFASSSYADPALRPMLVVTTTEAVVPEPTAASLSLLLLAPAATRRWRRVPAHRAA